MKTITLGVFNDKNDAEDAIIQILNKGIDRNSISYLYRNKEGGIEERMPGEEKNEKSAGNQTSGTEKAKDVVAGLASGATTGGVLGAIAGLTVSSGILPGLGAFFVGGPIATALGLGGVGAAVASGAVTGAGAGSLIGALLGHGLNESDAKDYQNQITDGNIFVSVDHPDPNAEISNIFTDNGAVNIKQHTV